MTGRGSMRSRALALLLLAFVSTAAAQQPSALAWPAITRDTKPWTRWWWLGSAVDKQSLSTQIGELAAAGFGGVEVTAVYGAKGADSAYIPYLSPKWVDMIAHTAAETRRRGMGLDLPQGSGWRMGGPSVGAADVNASLSVRVDSAVGESWQVDLTGHRVDAIVAVSSDGQRVDIASGSPPGVVRWTPPSGRWTIYIAETRF